MRREGYSLYKGYTISEVAKLANVSIATVSRVLNQSGPVKQSTQNNIMSVIKQLEEEKAPPYLARATEKNSKVILASFPELRNPFYGNIFKGISETARAHKYNVLYYQMENYAFEESYSFLTESKNYAGLIIAHVVPNPDILKQLSSEMPVVMCAEHNDSDILPYVSIDDFNASYSAINYLLGINRRRISLLNSSLRNNYACQRERAFRSCLADHGIEVNESWVAHVPEINYDLALGVATSILKQENRPDAFFCISDVFAAAAINAAKSLGLSVPKDVSVIGFDNIDISTMTMPTITTVSQPTYQIGAQACSLLIEQIEYPSTEPRHIMLNTELILREST